MRKWIQFKPLHEMSHPKYRDVAQQIPILSQKHRWYPLVNRLLRRLHRLNMDVFLHPIVLDIVEQGGYICVKLFLSKSVPQDTEVMAV